MSSVVEQRSRRERLKSVLLTIAGRILLSRIFMRFVMPPLMAVGYVIYACIHAFGPRRKFDVPSGGPVHLSEWAELAARIQESKDGPQRKEISEEHRARMQSMTWGTAGAAVVILVAIATSSKAFVGPAITIAAMCFAFTIPLLIVFGFAISHHLNPARPPPEPTESSNATYLILAAQFVFAVGIGALLWSFDIKVALAFMVACCLAWRAYSNLVVHSFRSSTVGKVSVMLQEAVEKAKQPVAANDPGKADAPATAVASAHHMP
jgi:hypothetical protein